MLRERRQFSGMQRVILLDELGEQFGAVHEYHGLRTPVDAIRLLAINYPEFNKHLIESGKRGVGYKVIQSEAELTLDDMLLPFGSKDLIIAPVIGGSGDGWGQIITGVALVGLAVGTLGIGAIGAGGVMGFGAGTSTVLGSAKLAAAVAIGGNIGAAMALGGVSRMLSPQPDVPSGGLVNINNKSSASQSRGADDAQSYAYQGAINSVGAGATIPVAFGKVLIGSHIISADIDVEDTSDPFFEASYDPDPRPNNTFGNSSSYGGGWRGEPDVTKTTINGFLLDHGWQAVASDGSLTTSGIEPGDNRLKLKLVEDNELTVGRDGTMYLGNNSLPSNEINIDLTKRGYQALSPDVHSEFSGDTQDEHFVMVFRLDNGLYQLANPNEPTSTKFDGRIVFSIHVSDNKLENERSAHTYAIQGMFDSSELYQVALWWKLRKQSNVDWYRIRIKVSEANVAEGVTFEVKQYGYRFIDGTRADKEWKN